MRNTLSLSRSLIRAVLVAALVVIAFQNASAQPPLKSKKPDWTGPKVTQIDINGLKKLLKPNGKPVLINFWATWCDPCREEFPDLVKLDAAYKGKIDFFTVSLDDLADIKTFVPKFLGEQKAEMPAYLLKTPDDDAAIALVSPDWKGNLPLTILLSPDGKTAYVRNGIVKYATITAEVDKLIDPPKSQPAAAISALDFVKIVDGKREEAIFYYENNWKVYRESALKKGLILSYELIDATSEKDSQFDLVLVTRYRNEQQYQDSEKNFEPILKELRPNGPMLKNALKPNDFRKNVFFYKGTELFAAHK